MSIKILINGSQVEVPEDVTLAAAFYVLQQRRFRTTPVHGQPRSLFCGMGICYDCVVKVNGRANIRSCQVRVEENMVVDTQHGEPNLKDIV